MASKPKRSKYGNVKTKLSGVVHASKKQGLRWVLLKQWERDGKIMELRREVPYRLEVNGKLICKYIADHVYWEVAKHVVTPYGPGTSYREVCEDVKGFKTAIYRLKKKLMLACHGIEISEV